MERFSNRRWRQFLGAVLMAALLAPVMTGLIAAQGGDQFLDGIGETALVARYLLNGNAEDSSRNHFHASLVGSGAVYVEDARFGRALELAGNGSHAQLPGNALAGEDTISVTGWLYLPTGASGPVFDFGQSASSRLFATVSAASGFSAGFAGGQARGVAESKAVPVNQWFHLAVVLDPANRLLTTYLDGVRAGQAANVGVNAAQLIGQGSADANRLYVGRSLDEGAATLHGRLRDVRVYRVALTDAQVAAIVNAASARPGGRGRGAAPAPVVSTAAIPKESPLASRLDSVPDIKADTTVGRLPRLPREIPAVYRDKAKGPAVRVIWPSPKDTSQVATPGTYTVTGRVPGTAFEPKATVTVKPAGQAGPAPRANGRVLPTWPGRPQPGHQGARHAVHPEPRQVHQGTGRD